LCHASDDKPGVADPLAAALRARGLRVWLDRAEILVGDVLTQKIDDGLAHARFGAVMISQAVLARETTWVRRELDALAAREADEGRVVVLPIWHGVTKDDVASYSPTLASKLALETAKMSIDAIAGEIALRCQRDRQRSDVGAVLEAPPMPPARHRGKPTTWTYPTTFMGPSVSVPPASWPAVLLRAVVNHQLEPDGAVARIGTPVHRALPRLLEASPLSSGVARVSWDPGQHANSLITKYTADLANHRVGWCGVALPAPRLNPTTVKVVVDLGLNAEAWPLPLDAVSSLWANVLTTALDVSSGVVPLVTAPSPPPSPSIVELFINLAEYAGTVPPVLQNVREAIDFSTLGRSTGQPFRSVAWAAWADEVLACPARQVVVRAWRDSVHDFGFLDPEDGLTALSQALANDSGSGWPNKLLSMSTPEAQGPCQNPNHGYADAEVRCPECRGFFCRGHARHPDHSMPRDDDRPHSN
jgi:hypothetical protein